MNPNKLTMLPSLRYDEATGEPITDCDGFVDDQVVLALVAGVSNPRSFVDPGDLVLAADDMDFAGWRTPFDAFSRIETPLVAIPQSPARRAAPPVFEEPGLGVPHRGQHRWWLAGLAGAFSTLLFSVLLLTLSSRGIPNSEGISFIRVPQKTPPQPLPKADQQQEDTALSGIAVPK